MQFSIKEVQAMGISRPHRSHASLFPRVVVSVIVLSYFAVTAPGSGAWDLEGRLREGDRPQFSSDGKLIAYTVYHSSRCADRPAMSTIMLTSEAGTSPAREITPKRGSWRFTWAPSAPVLAFYLQDCQAGSAPALGLYDAANDVLTELKVPGLDPEAGWPQWTPDGKQVLVVTRVQAEVSQGAGDRPVGIEWRTASAGAPLIEEHARSTYASSPTSARAADLSLKLIRVSLNGEQRLAAVGVIGLSGMQSIYLSPSGKWAVYCSQPRWNKENPAHLRLVVDVGLLNLETGRAQLLLNGTEIKNYTQEEGLKGNLAWHPNRDILILLHQQVLWQWDAQQGLRKLDSTPTSLLYPNLLAFFADGNHVLVGLGEVGWDCAGTPCTTPSGLARIDLQNGKVEVADVRSLGKWHRLFTSRAGTVIPGKSDTALVEFENLTTGTLSLLSITFGRNIVYRQVLDELGTMLFTDQRQDGTLLCIRESLQQPQRLEAVTEAVTSWRSVPVYSAPAPKSFPLTTKVFTQTVTNYEGKRTTIRTAVIGQPGKLVASTPAFVIGYPGESFSSLVRAFGSDSFAGIPAEYLVAMGYNLILVDLPMRPVGGGPGDFLKDMRELVLPQVEGAVQRGLVDGGRLGILGYSTGGYLSSGLSIRTSLFRVVIGINSITYDPVSTFSMIEDGAWATRRLRFADTPWTNPQLYDDNSPLRHADRIQAAVFLVFAGQDRPERVLSAKMFLNALTHAGKRGYLVGYPNEGHSTEDWSPASKRDLLERLSAFLERYMPPSNRAVNQ
jgi:dipeptidyl aminopeptidase/acylaminoacyl peptidase